MGQGADKHLVGHDSQCVDVGGVGSRTAQQTLRRDVLHRTDGMGLANRVVEFVESRDAGRAEVDDFGVAVAIDHDVLGFQVAMHHLQALEGAQGRCDVAHQAPDFLDLGPGIVEHPLAQAAAFDVLGHVVEETTLAPRMDLHHARMIDVLADPFLADEPVEIHIILRERLRRCFQDQTLPGGVFDQVDVTTRAARQRAQDPVAVDARIGAEHRRNDLPREPAVRLVDILVRHSVDADKQAARVVLAATSQGGVDNGPGHPFQRRVPRNRTRHELAQMWHRERGIRR